VRRREEFINHFIIESFYFVSKGIQNMSSGNQQANLAAQMQFGPLLYSYQLAMAQAAQQAQQQAQSKAQKTKSELRNLQKFMFNINFRCFVSSVQNSNIK
jgi:hypothetical protein